MTKTGTLACRLFGHKFAGRDIVYKPHYLKLVELGLAMMCTDRDWHYRSIVFDNCVRCGLPNPHTNSRETEV